MGATYQENKIELIDNIHIFFQRTGMLSYYKELEILGFFLDNFTGLNAVSSTRKIGQISITDLICSDYLIGQYLGQESNAETTSLESNEKSAIMLTTDCGLIS